MRSWAIWAHAHDRFRPKNLAILIIIKLYIYIQNLIAVTNMHKSFKNSYYLRSYDVFNIWVKNILKSMKILKKTFKNWYLNPKFDGGHEFDKIIPKFLLF